MPSLIYIADPMCSWCYGFGPELNALRESLPELSVHVVLGGLRAYNKQPADAQFRAQLKGHWEQVALRTGLPFSEAGMAAEDFVYDTEPACRAVVTARLLAAPAALPVFGAIQQAFYVGGQDVTRGTVLASVAAAAMTSAGVPTNPDDFLATWHSDTAITATRDDFMQTQRWGVGGFPTLVLERDGRLDLVSAGYTSMPRLVELMQSVLDGETEDAPGVQPGLP